MTELLTAFNAMRKEIGTKKLASALGVSESAIRMVSTGNYPDPTAILTNFAAQFIDPPCPFTDEPITKKECNRHADGPRPSGGYTLQQWWDACQTCPYKGKRV